MHHRILWKTSGELPGLTHSPLPTVAATQGTGPAQCAFICLHGFGSNPENLWFLSQELRTSVPSLWIFPQGPQSVPMSAGGAQWFSLFSEPFEELKESTQALEILCKEVEKETGLPRSRIVILGFSQGASTILHWGLNSVGSFGALVALSGFLLPSQVPALPQPASLEAPIFLAHGLEDQVVFPVMFYETQAYLQRQGFQVTSKGYPALGHGVNPMVLQDLMVFLEKHFR